MRTISILAIGLMVIGLALGASARRKKLQLSISKDDVKLAERTLYFKINRPADSAEIKVYSTEGNLLAERVELYDGARAGTRLSITWPKLLGDAENFRIALKVTDVDEFWIGWEVVRFYVEIPHEEVVFETGKWDIRPSEAPKLEEPLEILKKAVKKHKKNMDIQVYVGGYTDTVGSISANRELSRNRARSIARYFVRNGLKGIKIFVRGFGEEVLAVQTGDNVPNERNRRASYIISTFPPQVSGPGGWQRLN